jgi:acyl-CoA thioesterase I
LIYEKRPLVTGFNLPEGAAFPNILARRLHADGYGDVIIFNGSVAGETTADALQRLPSALQSETDLVIVELGANDMLNGTDPRAIFDNLDQIISFSKAEGARVILAGMVSLPKFGPAYKARSTQFIRLSQPGIKSPFIHFFCAAFSEIQG